MDLMSTINLYKTLRFQCVFNLTLGLIIIMVLTIVNKILKVTNFQPIYALT